MIRLALNCKLKQNWMGQLCGKSLDVYVVKKLYIYRSSELSAFQPCFYLKVFAMQFQFMLFDTVLTGSLERTQGTWMLYPFLFTFS